MKKVVFICNGNMHRSPTAEALYNVLKNDDSHAESYGTRVDFQGIKDRKISSFMLLENLVNEVKKHRTDISDHICTQATPEVLKDADKIIVIAEEENIPDWLRNYKYEKWELPDPEDLSKEYVVGDVKNIKVKVKDLLGSMQRE